MRCYALAACLLVIAGCSKQDGRWAKQGQAQNRAVALTLPLLEGNSHFALESVLGKKTVLLAFFTTWCPYCKESMPYLQNFYDKNKSKNFELIGIDIQESHEDVNQFVKKYGLTFPVALANDPLDFKAHYPVRFLPTLYLISQNGEIKNKFEGFHPSVLDEIAELL